MEALIDTNVLVYCYDPRFPPKPFTSPPRSTDDRSASHSDNAGTKVDLSGR